MHDIVNKGGDEYCFASTGQAGDAKSKRGGKQTGRAFGESVQRNQRFISKAGERRQSLRPLVAGQSQHIGAWSGNVKWQFRRWFLGDENYVSPGAWNASR